VWKIQRLQGVEAGISTVVDDGEDKLCEEQLENKFEELNEQMQLPAFVGDSSGSSSRITTSPNSHAPAAVDGHQVAEPAEAPTPKKAVNPFASRFEVSPLPASQALPSPTLGLEDRVAKKGKAAKGKSDKPPRPGKAVNSNVLSARAASKAAPKHQGRPKHDSVLIGDSQLKLWTECTDTDETFFGAGYKVHKAFLTRTKNAIEMEMHSSKEQCLSQMGRYCLLLFYI
jgi:hypothetical protein